MFHCSTDPQDRGTSARAQIWEARHGHAGGREPIVALADQPAAAGDATAEDLFGHEEGEDAIAGCMDGVVAFDLHGPALNPAARASARAQWTRARWRRYSPLAWMSESGSSTCSVASSDASAMLLRSSRVPTSAFSTAAALKAWSATPVIPMPARLQTRSGPYSSATATPAIAKPDAFCLTFW